MSHTNSTNNYSLPLFVDNDKPAWLTDFNTAMTSIDTGMNESKVTAETASTNVANVKTSLDTANQNIATLQQTSITMQAQVNNNTTAISNLQTDVGNTATLETTAKTCVGGINEVVEQNKKNSSLFATKDNAIVFPTSYETVIASASHESTYIATENCWVTAIGVTNSTNNNLSLSVTESGIYNQVSRPVESVQIAISIPLKKGQKVTVGGTGLSSLMLRKNV